MAGRWITILLLVVLTAGCGISKVITNQNEVQTLHGSKEWVIEFWNTYSDEENRILERELIPAFERQFPDIKVISVRQAYSNGMKNTLFSRAFSNRGPDVVRMHMDWVPDFYQNGLLMPLNEFPDFRKVADALNREALSAGFHQNQYFSLPLDMYIQAAIYNRELLKRAGYSKPPRTMEEILELARRKRYIIGLGGLDTWKTLPYIYSLGGSLTDTTFSKATGYLDGEATVRAVEKLLLLYKEGLIDRMVGEEGGDNWEGVKSGNVLITGEGPWFYSIWTDTELDRALKWTAPYPFPNVKGPLPVADGEHLVIMKGSKQKEAAWTFLKWMTDKEAQLKMSRVGLFPTNLEAVKSMTVDVDSYVYPYQMALDNAFLRPSVKNWGKIDEIYTLYMRQIFRGEISVKDGLTRAAEEIDRLFARSR
ncbi:extracellular solute-binding protein [Paenibacillus rhizophilus]|uniref:Extracellular solute-binding protein n=1 Tax=Paenibacillus rhizophilus TaxID=1850366 RepID=A0A3N9P279_9BACL|nr:extracellular solute-binding protein [Paenibacillus rhizophilus]RQW09577.1 extracellular solute-binding protein [Paenibacillus rhizophilus]